ncbi:type II toxin-antitoxin system VapC family toxin [Deinococcus sp.]|uniref:type II toxin-antitoxin system VapC family toxin n=1 Tax=Deinococcus sp. TaxID=47478 RepID=UPI003CC60096
MISLETNIVLSALFPSDSKHDLALELLSRHQSNTLIISPPVYSELRASRHWTTVNSWLGASAVSTEWRMPPSVWERAGEAVRGYADLRKSGTLPRRIAADFLIAAHAEHHGAEVMTFDAAVYKAVFPAARLIEVTPA